MVWVKITPLQPPAKGQGHFPPVLVALFKLALKISAFVEFLVYFSISRLLVGLNNFSGWVVYFLSLF